MGFTKEQISAEIANQENWIELLAGEDILLLQLFLFWVVDSLPESQEYEQDTIQTMIQAISEKSAGRILHLFEKHNRIPYGAAKKSFMSSSDDEEIDGLANREAVSFRELMTDGISEGAKTFFKHKRCFVEE